jgi:Zn finger protein HypA/HybF involved in hydrogenase expression
MKLRLIESPEIAPVRSFCWTCGDMHMRTRENQTRCEDCATREDRLFQPSQDDDNGPEAA